MKLTRAEVEGALDQYQLLPDGTICRMARALIEAWEALKPFVELKDSYSAPGDGYAMVILDCNDLEAARKALPPDMKGGKDEDLR